MHRRVPPGSVRVLPDPLPGEVHPPASDRRALPAAQRGGRRRRTRRRGRGKRPEPLQQVEPGHEQLQEAELGDVRDAGRIGCEHHRRGLVRVKCVFIVYSLDLTWSPLVCLAARRALRRWSAPRRRRWPPPPRPTPRRCIRKHCSQVPKLCLCNGPSSSLLLHPKVNEQCECDVRTRIHAGLDETRYRNLPADAPSSRGEFRRPQGQDNFGDLRRQERRRRRWRVLTATAAAAEEGKKVGGRGRRRGRDEPLGTKISLATTTL